MEILKGARPVFACGLALLFSQIQTHAPLISGHAVMFSSGMAAIFTLLLHIHPKRVVVEGGYHGTHKAIALCARQVGSTTYFQGPEPLSSQPQEGDLWWLEVPRNATCEVVDIAAYVSPEFL